MGKMGKGMMMNPSERRHGVCGRWLGMKHGLYGLGVEVLAVLRYDDI